MAAVLILGVTSSTGSVGVAVGRGDEGTVVLAQATSSTDRRHAEEVTPLLLAVLSDAGVHTGELTHLAVDVGPGRFTGLRVGMATVRAMAFALDLPVIGVSSLELLAAGLPERPVAAVIDARRHEVFQQVFDVDGPLGPPVVGPPGDLARLVPADAVAVGDGADRYPQCYGSNVRTGHEPSAGALVLLAAARSGRPSAPVEPLYLREPDVQVNIRIRES